MVTWRLIVAAVLLFVGLIITTSCTWLTLNLWRDHTAKHQAIEQQVIPAVNQLLEIERQRQQRGVPPPALAPPPPPPSPPAAR